MSSTGVRVSVHLANVGSYLQFSCSVFGSHQLKKEIYNSLSTKCFTLFTTYVLTLFVHCSVLSRYCNVQVLFFRALSQNKSGWHFHFKSIVLHLIRTWGLVEKICKINKKWNLSSPIFNNPVLLMDGRPTSFPQWSSKGIHLLGDIFEENGLCSFQKVCEMFNLPGTSFYFYLKLRSSMKA